MSIHEAAELIIQAGALAEGGDVFLLEMGPPVKISDLARNMIHLAGQSVRDSRNPGGGIEIITVGIRPGEKMFEELFYDIANAQKTAHPKILRALAPTHTIEISESLATLENLVRGNDEAAARGELFSFIGLNPPTQNTVSHCPGKSR